MSARDLAPAEATPAELVARARDLIPALIERSPRANSERRVPDETIETFHSSGIIDVIKPKRFGGHGGTYLTFVDILHELAYGCGSSAWVYGVLAEHQWVLAQFPEQGQRDAWDGHPRAVASSSIVPVGTAVVVPGGFRLSGRWGFSSGCDHAQWVVVGSFVQRSDGSKESHLFLVELDAFEIVDDWHVLGLCGTGSKSLVGREVFVPAHRAVPQDLLRAGNPPGAAVHPDFALARAPRSFFSAFTLPSVLVGLARRAVDVYAEGMKARMSRGVRLADVESIQLRVAEAAAEADTARLVLRSTCERNVAILESSADITLEQRVLTRRNTVYASRLARQAVDRVWVGSGAHALYEDSALQTVYRDALAAANHLFMSWEVGAAPYGQWRLGTPVTSPMV